MPTEKSISVKARPQLVEPAFLGFFALTAVAWAASLAVLPWLASVVTLGMLLARLRLARSQVTVGPDGIVARYLVRKVSLPWTDVSILTVENGLLQRRLDLQAGDRRLRLPLRGARLTRSAEFDGAVEAIDAQARAAKGLSVVQTDRSAPRLALAAAVLLCGAALIADKPWYWIAGPEATGTPDPCRAIAEVVGVDPAELVAEPTSLGPLEFLGCGYSDGDQTWTVRYRSYDRERLISGAGKAAEDYQPFEDAMLHAESQQQYFSQAGLAYEAAYGTGSGEVALVDVGDDAVLVEAGVATVVMFRQANVIGVATYAISGGPEPHGPLLELAHAAADAIPLT